MSKAKKLLLEETLPKFAIKLETLPDLINQCDKVNLEIGFGKGDFLAALSLGHCSLREAIHLTQPQANPLNIGCEPYVEGVVSLLKLIKTNDIKNIRIWPDDARLLIETLPSHSLDAVYILFPDPWPKRKQQKRRLVNAHFVSLLARKLKPSGAVFLATDHHDYASWSWQQFEPSFLCEDISQSSSDLFGNCLTKYHKKNLEGKEIKIFRFKPKPKG